MNIDKQTIIDAVVIINKAFDYDGDVFGILHNTAVDVIMALEQALKDDEEEELV